ncbi:mucin-3B [Magallana gigas]|uniref:mucin-3B n=1 Tax=Magallana gigas TaxID=29159 RepID=UPI00334243FB
MSVNLAYIGVFLSLVLQGIECCGLRAFEDSRCYLELVNHQYIVRVLPEGTHIGHLHTTCYLAAGAPHNQHSVHRHECDRAIHGEIVYLSSSEIHHTQSSIGQSKSTADTTITAATTTTAATTSTSANASTNKTHSDQHYICSKKHNSGYQNIFNNAEGDNCLTSYSVFNKLDHLRQHDHPCLSTLVTEMAGLPLSDCRCSGSLSHITYDFWGNPINFHQCLSNPVYKEVITRYLSHVPYNVGVFEPSAECHTRNQIWKDLLRLQNYDTQDASCFDEFIQHMGEAYRLHSHPPCSSCNTVDTHISTGSKYDAYKNGDCLSEHTVWSFLSNEHSSDYNGQSREQVIKHMAAINPIGTDDKCVCSKAFDLHYPQLTLDEFHWSPVCSTSLHSYPYQNAITHFLSVQYSSSTKQTCHSHAAVWQELNRIVKHNHDPIHCVETLIHIMRDAVNTQGDPCQCHSVASTPQTTQTTSSKPTTTKPPPTSTTQTTITTAPTGTTTQTTTTTTTQTTSKPTTAKPPPTSTTQTITTAPTATTTTASTAITTTTQTTRTTTIATTTRPSHSTTQSIVQTTGCSKIQTIEELAKYQEIYPEFNSICSNQALVSDLIVRMLCPSVPLAQNWKPGVKVTESCGILKNYIPVATFNALSKYPSDGQAGVFLGCTNSTIKIATQECGGRFSILEIPRQPTQGESFTHSASNYHVVMY